MNTDDRIAMLEAEIQRLNVIIQGLWRNQYKTQKFWWAIWRKQPNQP
ncbi:Uncharacterised protein [Moraxella caviae]|uniref:Uncharacterized protein n=1 Tax=Moraxella caviae TaxID=34060 RepID=A0A378R6C5_9GAMM|nr:Uncharacterised protein [Moraxella caviae]VEW10597.1 Uncharacterised protein [Moraxella caviae]